MSIYVNALLMLAATLGVIILARVLQVSRPGWAGPFPRTRAAGKRLALEETCMVDGKRRLILLRFDDHRLLLLTGGQPDLVVFPAPQAPGHEA